MNNNSFKSLLDNLPGMAYRCLNKADWPIIYASKGCYELTGYTSEELIARNYPEYENIIYPDDRVLVLNAVNEAIKEQKLYKIEYRITTKTGKVKWVLEQGGKYKTESKQNIIEGFVTEIKKSKKNELLLKSILDNAPLHIWAFDGTEYLYLNQSYYDYTGLEPKDKQTVEYWLKALHPDDKEQCGKIWEKAWNNKAEHDNFFRLKNTNNEYRNFWCHAVPIFDSNNNFKYFQGFNIDITASVIAKDKLNLTNTELLKSKEALEKLSNKLHKNLIETVKSLSNTVEYRDKYTAGHSKNVAFLASAIAEKMGLQAQNLEAVKIASLLHDVGKIAIPSSILNKADKLTEKEIEQLKMHPIIGYNLLKNIQFDQPVARIVLEHHEKINGSGYPYGRKGLELLLEAKIISVADTVEAITLPRPYRKALGIEKALEEVSSYAGILYDEDVVKACIEVFFKDKFSFDNLDKL